jgi:hypothetical protein
MGKGPSEIELYDLEGDPTEKKDVAADHTDVLMRLTAIMTKEHTPSTIFPLQSVDPPAKKK